MKRFIFLIILYSSVICGLRAQTSVCISTEKTISLVFPFPILHVDRGVQEILVQPVKESPAILLVKAASKSLPVTNLSVVIEDGSIYTFEICYLDNPPTSIYYLPANKSASIAGYARSILDNPRTVTGLHDYNWRIEAAVSGIYIKNNVIYYQLSLSNKSPVDYDIELLRFFIRDAKKGKRTAVQENDLKPLYTAGNASQIKANSKSVIVVALDKFTIPDAKYLMVQIMEKNGGRHLKMRIGNRNIMKAISLPDVK